MNLLLIDPYSAFLNFALRCDQAGHHVKWFCGPMKDGSVSKVGNGLGLRVMSTDDLGFTHRGGAIFISYLRAREVLATKAGSASLASTSRMQK